MGLHGMIRIFTGIKEETFLSRGEDGVGLGPSYKKREDMSSSGEQTMRHWCSTRSERGETRVCKICLRRQEHLGY